MTTPMETPKDRATLQVSGRDAEGNWILSGLAKRTYLIDPKGRCVPSREPCGLVLDPVYPEGNDDLLLHDIDTWPYKPQTNVILLGHAYNHPGLPSFDAAIRLEKAFKAIRVIGDRRATLTSDGRIAFSTPTRLDKVPLSYALAYGGRDAVTEAVRGNPVAELQPYLPAVAFPDPGAAVAAASPFVYPRNPSGRGYVLERSQAAIEAACLPNIEDPKDRLTPERLIPDDPWQWPAQPLPASLGWLDYGAFPRIAWLGARLDCDLPSDLSRVAEIRLGYAGRALFEEDSRSTPQMEFAATNGASLGLRLPYLEGGEQIDLMKRWPGRPV